MVVRCFALVGALCLLVAPASAQVFPFAAQEGVAPLSGYPSAFLSGIHYSYGIGLRKYINSFTSYQFPNPFPPGQDPLSRLEFPLTQWLGTFEAVIEADHWSLTLEGAVNLSRESDRAMQDSDWDDPADPDQKTIFSESRCRLDRAVSIDARLSVGALRVAGFSFRPVGGYRFQRFRFLTYDGTQADLFGGVTDLPGDGILFKQQYSQWYVGAAASFRIMSPTIAGLGSDVTVTVFADYGYVRAINEDNHLLRIGDRTTMDDTDGTCRHVRVKAGARLADNLFASVDFDFQRIVSHGSHRLSNNLFDLDFSFSGAKVWSDQASVGATAEVRF
jgi:outer membrane protease